MDHQTPPSPGPIKAEPLPSGFNELMQHNASASYPRDTIIANSVQVHSQPASRYGTPVPQLHHSQGVDAEVIYHQRGGGGDMVGKHCGSCESKRLTRLQHGYHQQEIYQHDNSPYGPIPEVSPQVVGRVRGADTDADC
jgi:hypothetical protein